MKGYWVVLLSVALIAGCGNKKNGGDEDATDVVEEVDEDTEEDTVEDLEDVEEDGPCAADFHCDDDDPCTDDTCDTLTGICSNDLMDRDEDGYYAAEVLGVTCVGGDDCDDADDQINPAGVEICDAIDQNCDGSILDAPDADDDDDGYLDDFCEGGTDCNDNNDEIYAGATEVCGDGVDQDCDTLIDDPTITIADLRVTNDAAVSEETSTAWSGSEFGVVWHDNRDGNYEIYFARISAAGAKEGSDVRITDASGDSSLPSIVHTGSEYAVSWSDMRDGAREVYFTRISDAGAKVGSDIRVTTAGRASRRSVLAWSGSEYGLAWSDERNGNYEIYFRRLAEDGTAVGAETRVTDDVGTSWVSVIKFAVSTYAIGWHDDRNESYDIFFGRVDTEGTKVGPDVRISSTSADAWVADMVWTGSQYAMSWHDNREGNYEIYFTRMNETGGEMGADEQITNISGSSYDSSLVYTGSEFVVAWHDDMTGDPEIYMARIDLTGTKTSGDLRITNEYDFSGDASLAWTGSRFGLSWTDERPGNSEIFFNVIDYCD